MTNPNPTRAEVEAAVEKLANSHLGMSLEEWSAVSNTILTCAADYQALRERAEAAEEECEVRLENELNIAEHLLLSRRAEAAAWNDAIEAAEAAYAQGFAAIRALRRAAHTGGEA